MENNNISSDSDKESKREFLKIQYQVLSERRVNHNSLLWNVPSLLFLAQTFLWTISLNSKIPSIICTLISVVAFFIGIAAYQCFQRNRYMEIADAEQMFIIEQLFRSEDQHDVSNCTSLIVHHSPSNRTWYENGSSKPLSIFLDRRMNSYLATKSSYDLWKWVFIFIISLSFIIFLYNLASIFPSINEQIQELTKAAR